jgi:hypothetical protein
LWAEAPRECELPRGVSGRSHLSNGSLAQPVAADSDNVFMASFDRALPAAVPPVFSTSAARVPLAGGGGHLTINKLSSLSK